jgi:nitrogen fixation protein NifU and related proteins
MAGAHPYDDFVMDHIKNARNYRVLDDANRKATGTNPLCGDEITVYLKLEGDTLAEIAFQCTCCGISMASASMMTEQMRGRHTDDVRNLVRAFNEILSRAAGEAPQSPGPVIQAMLETVRRYPARRRCAVLPWVTLGDILDTAAAGRF